MNKDLREVSEQAMQMLRGRCFQKRKEKVHSALGGNVPGAQGVLEKQEGVERLRGGQEVRRSRGQGQRTLALGGREGL